MKDKDKVITEDIDRAITVKEAAEMMGITKVHLRGFLKDGKIPYFNVSRSDKKRSIRIKKKAIEQFIQNNQGGKNDSLPIQP